MVNMMRSHHFAGFGDVHDLEAFGFALLGRSGTRAQGDDDVLGTAVAQVQRVGVALGAVAKDGDFLVLDQVHIAVAVVVNAHGVLHLVDGGKIGISAQFPVHYS
jgi:hypothetical protein